MSGSHNLSGLNAEIFGLLQLGDAGLMLVASMAVEGVLARGGIERLRRLAPVLVLACPGAARAEETFDDRHKALLERDDLQFSFEAETLPPSPSPDWLVGLLESLEWIAPVLHVLFWLAVAAGAAALLWFIVREVIGKVPAYDVRPKGRVQEAAQVYRPDEVRSRTHLADADQLAAAGQYDEAVRLLLHRSIEDIEERIPNAVRRATTAREVTAMAGLPEGARAWLAPLARAVEFSWFGGRSLGEDSWVKCRQAYTAFAMPETWARSTGEAV